MSIINQHTVGILPYRGYDDLGLPIGSWFGRGASTGDASGGDHTIQFDFAFAGQPRNSQLYSLEQIFWIVSGSGAFVGRLLVSNFDQGIEGSMQYSLNAVANEAGNAALIGRDVVGFKGIWLGQQAVKASGMSIGITIDNTDTQIQVAGIRGYVWSQRSTNAEGGPQRPPNGLFAG